MAGVGWGGVGWGSGQSTKEKVRALGRGGEGTRDGPLAGRLITEMNVVRMTGSKFITVRERR